MKKKGFGSDQVGLFIFPCSVSSLVKYLSKECCLEDLYENMLDGRNRCIKVSTPTSCSILRALSVAGGSEHKAGF